MPATVGTKEVEPGDLFVCTMGVTADRHDFIDNAIENGASAIVVSKDIRDKRKKVICDLVADSLYVPMKEKELAVFLQVA